MIDVILKNLIECVFSFFFSEISKKVLKIIPYFGSASLIKRKLVDVETGDGKIVGDKEEEEKEKEEEGYCDYYYYYY